MTPCRLYKNTEYSEETAACIIRQLSEGLVLFIFRVVKEALITLKMEAVNSFETLVPIYQYTRHHITEDYNFCQTVSIVTKYWISGAIKITSLSLFDIPGSKCCGTTIFIINVWVSNFVLFLQEPVAATSPRTNAQLPQWRNYGALVTRSPVTPARDMSLELSVSAETCGRCCWLEAQHTSQLCFWVFCQGFQCGGNYRCLQVPKAR